MGQFPVPFIGFSNFQVKMVEAGAVFMLAAGSHHGLYVAGHVVVVV